MAEAAQTELILHQATRVNRGAEAMSRYRESYPEELLKYFLERATIERHVVAESSSIEYSAVDAAGKPVVTKGSKKQEVRLICAEMPTFERFMTSIGVSRVTAWKWRKKYPEWSDAWDRCQEIQKDFLIQGMVSGRIPSLAGIFVAKNVTDMTDERVMTTVQSEREKPLLADRTPAQLEALRIALVAAEAVGMKLSIDIGEPEPKSGTHTDQQNP